MHNAMFGRGEKWEERKEWMNLLKEIRILGCLVGERSGRKRNWRGKIKSIGLNIFFFGGFWKRELV